MTSPLPERDWASLPADAVLRELNSSPLGLTGAEAQAV